MQPLVSFAAILAAAATPFANAQTLTISTSAAAPSSTASTAICPASNGQVFSDPSSIQYQVYCGAYLVSSTFYIEDTSLSAGQCMHACDEKVGCLGAVWYEPGRCELATGDSVTVRQSSDFDAFVRVSPSASSSTPSNSSTWAAPTSLQQSTSTPAFTTYISPLPTGNISTACSFSSIDCPVCDGKTVLDDFGNLYNVTCDSAVFADGVYDVTRSVSPQGCMEQCDGYPWCLGATWHPEGNCELARLGNATPIQMPGYTAFMSVAFSSTKSSRPTSVSWSAPSTRPSQGYSTTLVANSTASATTSSPSAEPTCDRSTVSCPSCEGSVVTDMLGQDYLTQCYIRPACESTASLMGNYTAERCLERCDSDATCLAAIYNSGTCDLCQQDVVSIAAFSRAVPGFAVFLSPAVWETQDPRLPLASNTSTPAAFSSISQFTNTPVPLPATASTTLVSSPSSARDSSSTTSEGPIFSILPFPPLSEQVPTTIADPTMSILPFPALETTSSTSEQMLSILPFPALTSSTIDGTVSMLPFPALPTMTASEEMLSVLPSPALSEQLSSTTTDGIMSILPFPTLGDQTASPNSDGIMSILPFPALSQQTASATSDGIMSILPFPALSPQGASSTSDGTMSILPFPPFSQQATTTTPTASITSFSPIMYEPPRATDSMSYSLMPNVSSVECPADQNLAVYDADSNKAYQIKCDARIQAAQIWTVSASDFAACAGLCTAGCDGVNYYSTSCGLITGISALIYQQDATAAAVVAPAGASAPIQISITTTLVESNNIPSLSSGGTGLASQTTPSSVFTLAPTEQARVSITRTFTV